MEKQLGLNFTDRSNAVLFCGSSLLFMFRVCPVFLSVHYSLAITCWDRADLLALLYVMFYCIFVTFQCVVLAQMWCLIVLILGLRLLSYFYYIV